MKIFLAALEVYYNQLWIQEYNNYLTSFFYLQNKKGDFYFEKILNKLNLSEQIILLDSGAFSAASQGIKIDIDNYIRFLHKYKNNLFAYIELDVKANKNISLEDSIIKTKENQQIMEAAGLNPLPVYHIGTRNYKYLNELLEKYNYIMIGGMSGEKFDIKKELDYIFFINERYKKKIHGLGQTSLKSCLRYPFYSVDSTTWLIGGKTGEVIILDWKLNKLLYVFSKDEEILDIFPSEDLLDCFGKKNYYGRTHFNLKTYIDLQKYVTDIWKERGIEWKD